MNETQTLQTAVAIIPLFGALMLCIYTQRKRLRRRTWVIRNGVKLRRTRKVILIPLP